EGEVAGFAAGAVGDDGGVGSGGVGGAGAEEESDFAASSRVRFELVGYCDPAALVEVRGGDVDRRGLLVAVGELEELLELVGDRACRGLVGEELRACPRGGGMGAH